jgi:chromosome segregation ATPase
LAVAGGAKAPAPLPEAALESQITAQERQIVALKDEVRTLGEELAVLRSGQKDAAAALTEAQQALASVEGQLESAKRTEEVALGQYGAISHRLYFCYAALAVTTALSTSMYFKLTRPSGK